MIKYVRVGSLVNIHAYDDGDYDAAIETDAPIKAGDPVDPEDVVTLKTQRIRAVAVTNIDSPSEVSLMSGQAGDLVLAYQVNAGGMDDYTIYAYDGAGPSLNNPFVIDAPGTGTERWIAVLGRNCAITDVKLLSTLLCSDLYVGSPTINLRIVWTSEIASRTLTFDLQSGNRTLTLKSNVTLNQNLQTTNDVEFNTVKCQGNQVLTARQSAVADASAASAISLGSGSDQVDRAAFNTALSTLVSEINGIKDQLNALLNRARTHGLIAT